MVAQKSGPPSVLPQRLILLLGFLLKPLGRPGLDLHNGRHKADGHVKLPSGRAGIILGILKVSDIHLPNGHQIVRSGGLCHHFPDVSVGPLQIGAGRGPKGLRQICPAVHPLVQIADGIHPVAVHAFFVPEADDVKDPFPGLVVVPV